MNVRKALELCDELHAAITGSRLALRDQVEFTKSLDSICAALEEPPAAGDEATTYEMFAKDGPHAVVVRMTRARIHDVFGWTCCERPAPTPPLGSLHALAASWEREAQELREEASRYVGHTAERLREGASAIDNCDRELREALATTGLPALPDGWNEDASECLSDRVVYAAACGSFIDVRRDGHVTFNGNVKAATLAAVLAHHMARVSTGDGAT